MNTRIVPITVFLTSYWVVNAIFAGAPQQGGGRGRFDVPAPPRLTLFSASFKDLDVLLAKYTCIAQPAGISPELHWTNAPKETVSFVVMFHDLDPRVNKRNDDTLHWVLWNISSSVSALPEGMSEAQLPEGSYQSGIGGKGYGGPCMPPGGRPHHYSFDVYAMDKKLEVGARASRDDIYKAMDGHILDHAMIIAHWERPLR